MGDEDGEEEGGGVSGDRPPAPNKTAPKKAAAGASSSATSTTQQQPQQWEWESVRNKLRDALTEMSVLSDVITVATKVNTPQIIYKVAICPRGNLPYMLYPYHLFSANL